MAGVARVLHIQGDPKLRATVAQLLVEAGHQVLEAETGLDGIRVAEAQPPDLILVDLHLPDLDGYEVTLRLKGMRALESVPVVTLNEGEGRQPSLAVGASGIIDKPFHPRVFQRAIGSFLEGHRERADDTGEFLLRERSQKIVERFEHKIVELSEANQRLEDMARLRRHFLQNISHELATPLTPVVGYLALLLNEELGPLTPLQRKSLTSIDSSIQRLRALIETLVDVSALETERMQLYERPYDFADIARKAVLSMGPRFDEKSIELSVELVDGPIPARGDADKLRRAMLHILDNALKFTPKGGEVAIGLRRSRDPRGFEACAFAVADTGPGIPRAQFESILQPFYQGDGSATREHGGVGLGLAFAKRVSAAFGGGIDITSPPTTALAGRLLNGTEVSLRVLCDPDMPERPRRAER